MTRTTRPARRTTISGMERPQDMQPAPDALPAADRRELDQLVIDYHEFNQAKNAAENAAKKKRAALLKKLLELGRSEYVVAFKKGQSTITLEAEVGAAERQVIDIETLRKLVPDDSKFLSMVSASASSVEEVAGANIANQCKVPTKGETNVSVKVKK